MQRAVFFPGKLSVVFRKGPGGFLLQEPSAEARRIKDDPTRQDRSALREDLVRQNALAAVRQRGGDASDRTEVLGDYILQFGKYKGKAFRWLLENDVGSTCYLVKDMRKEEAAGRFRPEGHSKDSLLSFVNYALSFAEIQSLLAYEARGEGVVTATSEDDQLVGFGDRAKSTWKEEETRPTTRPTTTPTTNSPPLQILPLGTETGTKQPSHSHGLPWSGREIHLCPSKVYSLYRDKGMAKEMSWPEFQQSPFYEAERQRTVEERKK